MDESGNESKTDATKKLRLLQLLRENGTKQFFSSIIRKVRIFSPDLDGCGYGKYGEE